MLDAYILPRTTLAVIGACLGVSLCVSRGLVPGGGRLVWGGIVLVGTAAVLACLTSINPTLSLVGAYSRYEDLPTRLAYAGLFWSAATLVDSPFRRRQLMRAYVLGCSMAAVEALYQGWTHSLPRADGNLGQPNLLGALLAMAVPVCLWLVSDRGDEWLRMLWTFCLCLLGGGLLVSQSRSAWLGAGAAGVLFVVFEVGRRLRSTRVALGAGLAATAAALAAGVAVVLLSPLRSLNSDVGSARLHLWPDAFRLFLARPLTGWGEDSMGLVFGRFLTGNWEPGNAFDRAHSLPLDMLGTQGIVGLVANLALWSVILLGIGRRLLSAREGDEEGDRGVLISVLAAALAYLVWASIDFDWAPATAAVWLLAGTAWAAVAEPARIPAAGGWVVARVVGVVALGVVSIEFGVLPLFADHAYYVSEPDVAVRLDPLQPQYHTGLAASLTEEGDASGAVAEYERAVSLGSYDSSVLISLGDAQQSLGQVGAARASYGKALELDPYSEAAKGRLASVGG